jgi:hypothetical protein
MFVQAFTTSAIVSLIVSMAISIFSRKIGIVRPWIVRIKPHARTDRYTIRRVDGLMLFQADLRSFALSMTFINGVTNLLVVDVAIRQTFDPFSNVIRTNRILVI